MSETKDWRTRYRVHPAAKNLPMLPDHELAELGDDIEKNGLQEPITLWIDNTAEKDGDASIKPTDYPSFLIDGRNRLDAMARRGLDLNTVRCVGNAANAKKQERQPVLTLCAWRRQSISRGPDGRLQRGGGWVPGVDPWAYVASANLHRRHLSAEDRRHFRAAYITAHVGDSDRKIAVALQVSHPTIAADRKRIAATGKDLPVDPPAPVVLAGKPAVPAEPVVPPAADAQLRLGRDNKTRRLPQLPPPALAARAPSAVRTKRPEGNKQERIAAVDRYMREEAGLSEGDLIDHWVEQHKQQQAEQQQREAELLQRTAEQPQPTDSHGRKLVQVRKPADERMLAAMAEATAWLDGFCRKWGIDLARHRECYFDMSAYFELKAHDRAVKLEADKEAELRQQIEQITYYGQDEADNQPVATDDAGISETKDNLSAPEPPRPRIVRPRG